jgi:hypothetical protein
VKKEAIKTDALAVIAESEKPELVKDTQTIHGETFL